MGLSAGAAGSHVHVLTEAGFGCDLSVRRLAQVRLALDSRPSCRRRALVTAEGTICETSSGWGFDPAGQTRRQCKGAPADSLLDKDTQIQWCERFGSGLRIGQDCNCRFGSMLILHWLEEGRDARRARSVVLRVNLHASPVIEPSRQPCLKLWYSFTFEHTHEYPRHKKPAQLQLVVVFSIRYWSWTINKPVAERFSTTYLILLVWGMVPS